MRVYEVEYWSEGGCVSGMESVIVVAKDKKTAINFVNEKCGVYKADRSMTKAEYLHTAKALLVERD